MKQTHTPSKGFPTTKASRTLDTEDINNPRAWFYKAQMFRSLVLLVVKEFKEKFIDEAKIDNIAVALDAFNTVPYLTCLALEIYMKGRLVSEGLTGIKVSQYKHKVWLLRKECLKRSKNILLFDNPDIRYITDTLGPALMNDGGVRYPSNKQTVVPYDSCIFSLDLLHDDLRKISNKFPRILSL